MWLQQPSGYATVIASNRRPSFVGANPCVRPNSMGRHIGLPLQVRMPPRNDEQYGGVLLSFVLIVSVLSLLVLLVIQILELVRYLQTPA